MHMAQEKQQKPEAAQPAGTARYIAQTALAKIDGRNIARGEEFELPVSEAARFGQLIKPAAAPVTK
jgi:hypothetical protein